jgi:hypothetical protein
MHQNSGGHPKSLSDSHFVACSDCSWFIEDCNHETVKKSQN